MITITICIGSSCYLKNSKDIISILERLITLHNVGDKVTLMGSFCMGHCTEGVSTMFGDEFVGNVNPENAVEVFRQHVLEPMGRADGE